MIKNLISIFFCPRTRQTRATHSLRKRTPRISRKRSVSGAPNPGLPRFFERAQSQPLENFQCLSAPKHAKLEPQSPQQKRPLEFLECGAFRNAQTLEILEFLIFEITSAREFPGFERPKTRQTRATDAREKPTPRIPRVRSVWGRPNPGNSRANSGR